MSAAPTLISTRLLAVARETIAELERHSRTTQSLAHRLADEISLIMAVEQRVMAKRGGSQ